MTLANLAASPWALLALPVALYVVLAIVVGRRQSWPGEIRLAGGGTGMVLIAVWLMSFAALMAFFAAAYVEPPLNALGPVAVDGEMAVGTVVWIAVGQAGVRLAELRTWRDALRWLLSPRPYVALLVAGSAALSSVANAVHPLTSAAGYHLPAPWSYAASAVPGLVMFAVIHQLVILFRILRPESIDRPIVVIEPPRPGGQRTADSGQDRRSGPALSRPAVQSLPAPRVSADQLAKARRQLGPDATQKQLAEHLGVSTKTIQRRTRELDSQSAADWPRVVSE